MNANTTTRTPVFDYRALRLLIGIIALGLPFVVSTVSATSLSSISASYYTAARDLFVGMLFVVCALMWTYNGHTSREALASKIAAIAGVAVALFPTNCDVCKSGGDSTIHAVASVILFSVLAYFCFGPFRRNTKNVGGRKQRRSFLYLTCGWVMVGCMVGLAVAKLTLSNERIRTLQLTYWAEAIALGAFGVAWIVAGKLIPLLTDEHERLHLFSKSP